MNDLQKCELEILKEFDRICKKNNLSYTLCGGTMIGAVRHKGFIPWDDDIDVAMHAKDFKKFCKIAQQELDKKYFLQTSYTDYWDVSIAKIRMNGTTAIEKGTEKYNYHHGVWIDIFPIIGVKDNDRWIKCTDTLFRFRNILIKDLVFRDQYKEYPDWYKKVSLIMRIPLNIRRAICRVLDSYILRNREHEKYFCFIEAGGGISREYYLEDVRDYVQMQFEDETFFVASGYDRILTWGYGNYMILPPESERDGGGHILSIVDINNDYHKYLKTSD